MRKTLPIIHTSKTNDMENLVIDPFKNRLWINTLLSIKNDKLKYNKSFKNWKIYQEKVKMLLLCTFVHKLAIILGYSWKLFQLNPPSIHQCKSEVSHDAPHIRLPSVPFACNNFTLVEFYAPYFEIKRFSFICPYKSEYGTL